MESSTEILSKMPLRTVHFFFCTFVRTPKFLFDMLIKSSPMHSMSLYVHVCMYVLVNASVIRSIYFNKDNQSPPNTKGVLHVGHQHDQEVCYYDGGS